MACARLRVFLSPSTHGGDAVEDPQEKVEMRHPDVAGSAVTTREAFTEVYADLGWKLAEDSNAPAKPGGKAPKRGKAAAGEPAVTAENAAEGGQATEG